MERHVSCLQIFLSLDAVVHSASLVDPFFDVVSPSSPWRGKLHQALGCLRGCQYEVMKLKDICLLTVVGNATKRLALREKFYTLHCTLVMFTQHLIYYDINESRVTDVVTTLSQMLVWIIWFFSSWKITISLGGYLHSIFICFFCSVSFYQNVRDYKQLIYCKL